MEFTTRTQAVPHNWAMYEEDPGSNSGGGVPGRGAEPRAGRGGRERYLRVKAIDTAGTFFFRCDFHPTTMTGRVRSSRNDNWTASPPFTEDRQIRRT